MADVQLSTLGSVIKTAYEGQANTNAYTDAEKTKVAGVETGATADQTDAEILAAVQSATAGEGLSINAPSGNTDTSDSITTTHANSLIIHGAFGLNRFQNQLPWTTDTVTKRVDNYTGDSNHLVYGCGDDVIAATGSHSITSQFSGTTTYDSFGGVVALFPSAASTPFISRCLIL